MGSKTFEGVLFTAYPNDHPPVHVHGYYAEASAIVELADGTVRLAARKKAVKPRNAKQSDVNHILRTALKYADELVELWRTARG